MKRDFELFRERVSQLICSDGTVCHQHFTQLAAPRAVLLQALVKLRLRDDAFADQYVTKPARHSSLPMLDFSLRSHKKPVNGLLSNSRHGTLQK